MPGHPGIGKAGAGEGKMIKTSKKTICLCGMVLAVLVSAYGQTMLVQTFNYPVNRTFHGGPWGEFFDPIQELGNGFTLVPGMKFTIRLNLAIDPPGFGFATRCLFPDNGCPPEHQRVNGNCYPFGPGADPQFKEFIATQQVIAENGSRMKLKLYLYGNSQTEADYQISGNVSVIVATPVEIRRSLFPIDRVYILSLQVLDVNRIRTNVICPACTIQFPLAEIAAALKAKGITGLVGVKLFKDNGLVLDLGNYQVEQIPAGKNFVAAQIAKRDLLTEGGGYLLRIMGAKGEILAEDQVSLKF